MLSKSILMEILCFGLSFDQKKPSKDFYEKPKPKDKATKRRRAKNKAAAISKKRNRQ